MPIDYAIGWQLGTAFAFITAGIIPKQKGKSIMNKLGKYWMAAMAMWSGGQAMATEPYTVGKLLGIPEFNTLAPFLILAVLVMAAAVAAGFRICTADHK